MARIRSIKPVFFLDEDVAALDPLDRLAFIGLWTQADREGRMEYRPGRLRLQLLPYDEGDFIERLQRLQLSDFIIIYEVEGRQYVWIRNFTKHQRVHNTEAPSVLPPYNGEITVNPPLGLRECPTGMGRGRGKGKGKGKGKEIGGVAKTDPAPPPPSNGLPDWFTTCLEASKNFSCLLAPKYSAFWKTMSTAYDPYEWLKWDEQVHKADAWIEANPQRRPRQQTRFLKNWFERAVEHGRIQHAKEARAGSQGTRT